MRLDQLPRSDNVEDRRGQGGGTGREGAFAFRVGGAALGSAPLFCSASSVGGWA
jgi:hypothetical protein